MIGIDLGSRSVKIVSCRDGELVDSRVFDTIRFYRHYGVGGGELAIDFKGLNLPDDKVVATGYGKLSVRVRGAVHIPEIKAHVLGAVAQSGLSDFTLLDVGGQDTKVVLVREKKAVDFVTNDRCAASSGRYLEHMADILDIGLEELGRYCEEPAELSATCAIFGETELIARIVEGASIPELAAGVNRALYRRIAPMLRQLPSDVIVMSGGGALNEALRRIIAEETGKKVTVLPEAQLNGAIGCCVYGREMGWN